jgi:hypothetical protein
MCITIHISTSILFRIDGTEWEYVAYPAGGKRSHGMAEVEGSQQATDAVIQLGRLHSQAEHL